MAFKDEVLILGQNKSNTENRLQKITCTCGTEILLIPNVQAMDEAIEKHVDEHKSKAPQKGNSDYEQQIRDHLIGQIFEKASGYK